jgi:FtsP/CotA-like multicopper oxidase with cupredoxin domain
MRPKNPRRREFLKAAAMGAAGVAGSTVLSKLGAAEPVLRPSAGADGARLPSALSLGTVGDVSTTDFDPMAFLTDFDYGKISTLPNGQTLREYNFVAIDKEIEIAPGVFFPAWTFNGQVPGPTIRCTEGDRIRIHFANAGSHPHTIHFHGIHPAGMDGVFEIVHPGERFVYEFDAEPFGIHLYHCHTIPLKRHIHKGLYGTFIVDPREGRPQVDHEFVMVMNGFDTNFDSENEVYAVNTVAFFYQNHPIHIKVNDKVRIYLVNATEFDPINSFHLHAEFFHVYRTGTSLQPHDYTDTLMMCQAERHILEFSYRYPGRYMFHAHQSEFAELGWMGLFEVEERMQA